MIIVKAEAKDILKLWAKLGSNALGQKLFSKLLGLAIPYTGTIKGTVRHLEPGRAEVELADHWRVRNHLSSVHAIALANLGEFTTGLSVISQLKDTDRAILKSVKAEYLKKARGTLRAKAKHSSNDTFTFAEIFNSQNELVCRVTAEWLIGPKK